MGDWKAALKADPTDWLLEEENPPVRYFTLRDILDRPEGDKAVAAAKRRIVTHGVVPDLLRMQREDAYVARFSKFYTDKYRGLVWSLIVLAELGARADSQIKEQCEYLLANSQETQDGGFAMNRAARTGGGRITEVIPCLTGNMVWALSRLGYAGDPRLQRGIDWLTSYMRFNDGVVEDPQVPPYSRYETCWGRHTCHIGVVKAFKGLGAVPAARRTAPVASTIQKGAEFMLIHHIFRRSHNLDRVAKPGWLKFGFPLMYQTDVLEILDILTGLGIRGPWMDEALRLVLGKQDSQGWWRSENTYGSNRLLVPFGQKGKPSKWITLRAMRVLKRYSSIKP